MKVSFSFGDLRKANLQRVGLFKNAKGELCHSEPDGSDWSLNDWATAAGGEMGEAAGICKKIRRGDYSLDEVRGDLADEIADTVIYLDMLAYRAGIDLGQAVIQKWNATSERVGIDLRLTDGGTLVFVGSTYCQTIDDGVTGE